MSRVKFSNKNIYYNLTELKVSTKVNLVLLRKTLHVFYLCIFSFSKLFTYYTMGVEVIFIKNNSL